jgi:hypothetical protein
MRLWALVKKLMSEFAAMHEVALCDLGLRTCRQCRAIKRSGKALS